MERQFHPQVARRARPFVQPAGSVGPIRTRLGYRLLGKAFGGVRPIFVGKGRGRYAVPLRSTPVLHLGLRLGLIYM
jgi:hypothetical protein